MKYNLSAVWSSFLLLFVWELFVWTGSISQQILPAPSDILQTLIEQREILFNHTIQTLSEALVGLFIAILLGLFFALFLDLFPKIKRAIYPLLVVSQTIPIIALAPLLLIWFGFELTPKVIVVVLYCFFPITVSVIDGLANTDAQLIRLLKSMNATPWQVLKLVRFPNSLPNFFSGLRISATYAIVGAIVGEFVGGYRGLGILMQTAANSHAISLVFAAIVVTSLLSLTFFALVSILELFLLPWKR